jgi:hypothetical protein
MRLVLRAPGHLNGKEIGKLFGVTKQAISIQATGMLARIDARRRMKEALPFLIEDALPFAAADDKPAPVAISCVITPRARAPRAKESLRPPTPSVAWRNTPGEKKGGFGRISKIGKRPRKKAK